MTPIDLLRQAVEELVHNLAAYPPSPERAAANRLLLLEIQTISREIKV